MRNVYCFDNETHEPGHREIVNRLALTRYADSEARWRRNSILRDVYKYKAERKGMEGREKRDIVGEKGNTQRLTVGQDAYRRGLKHLLQHTDAYPVNDIGCFPYTARYRRRQSVHTGRIYAEGVDISKTPKRFRQIDYKGIDERGWGYPDGVLYLRCAGF